METLPDFIRMFVGLGIVIVLMGGLSVLLRRTGLAGAQALQDKSERLNVVERLPLDARRQLVLLQRDDVQHLVILSATGETVVETGIKSGEDKA